MNTNAAQITSEIKQINAEILELAQRPITGRNTYAIKQLQDKRATLESKLNSAK